MTQCPSCAHQNPDGSSFCSSCGATLSSISELPTQPVTPSGGSSSSSDPNPVRFLPGTMVAGRYRIVGLLGRGGMGEVYRADDLKVGQAVALKFLPRAFERDPDRLQRLMTEVRMARQVTHPNVCRVYDIGEAEGQHFLSMEYVDGDDLASLLRRIGRMPEDKAVEIARQLCAGLAAAHEQGILHRDLKPSNVILDGRGRVRITDFGLAGIAEEFHGAELSAGTPAYMSPEQLDRKEVSVKSDIYALGLVLYELFTGKTAFSARTPQEMARAQRETTPATPTTHVSALDPTIERVILRCMEKDPAERPESVLQIVAALPGGDPLAAALAAGETPSPEMVAAAGGEGSLRPAVAIALLVFVLLGIPLVAALNGRASLLSKVPIERNPQALAERGRQIAASFGYDERPQDSDYGFTRYSSVIHHIAETDSSPGRWNRLATQRPAALRFWYRQSPRSMVPVNPSGRVVLDDPDFRITGMTSMQLDPAGRLEFFKGVPPQQDTVTSLPQETDWATAFEAAGLSMADFSVAAPQWVPETFADQRAAWTGTYPDQPSPEIRVEAGAYRGNLVYFDIVHPWDRPTRQEQPPRTTTERAQLIFIGVLNVLIIGGAFFLARRNLRGGRGDRKGARRLGVIIVMTTLMVWVLQGSHVPDLNRELSRFLLTLGLGLLGGGLAWVLYIVLEPFVRRRWPQSLVSWNRLLAGRWRDPLVGKHLLFGAAIGVVIALSDQLVRGIPAMLGQPVDAPRIEDFDLLLGARWAAGELVQAVENSLISPMVLLFLFVLLRMFLRNTWVALGAFALLLGFLGIPQSGSSHLWSWFLIQALQMLMIGLVVIRFGLVSFIAAAFVGQEMLGRLPVTLDFSTWFAATAIIALLAAMALAIYGFRASLGGRTLLSDEGA